MALQDDCILWNKLGSNAEVTNSEIGSNFAIGGAPDYAAAKFGNGIRIDANNEVVSIANTPSQYDLAKGCIEMWVKPSYDVIHGVPQDAGYHMFISWGGHTYIYLHAGVGFAWAVNAGSTWYEQVAGLDMTANSLYHIAFAWDRTHATKKRRLYLDGVEIGSNNHNFNDTDMTSSTFYLGIHQGNSQNFGGIIDNIKWYNNCTDATIAAIIANRNNEGWPVSGNHRFFQMF